MISRGRLRLLRRAVDCFGFHLARLDMRQNSAVHERTVAELLDAAALTRPRLYIGLPDRFIEHGSREQCLTDAGLDAPAVIAAIERWWLPQAA